MQEAYEMAVEVLGLCIGDLEEASKALPTPTLPQKLEVGEDGIIVIVEFDMDAYRRKHNSKAVKKTLTIPEWLNEEAIEAGINFSQVLQEALVQKLAVGK